MGGISSSNWNERYLECIALLVFEPADEQIAGERQSWRGGRWGVLLEGTEERGWSSRELGQLLGGRQLRGADASSERWRCRRANTNVSAYLGPGLTEIAGIRD